MTPPPAGRAISLDARWMRARARFTRLHSRLKQRGRGHHQRADGGVAPLLIPYSPSIADPFDSAGQDADAPGKSVGKG